MVANVSGFLLILFFQMFSAVAVAEEVRVAVATNFLATAKEIITHFEQDTAHVVVVSSGSSGKLYVQIKNGAPFDVFFSADVDRPALLEEEGFAIRGSRFTYAVGRLTLWSADSDLIDKNGKTVLSDGTFEHLAIANPKTAPYGTAAQRTLQALGLWGQVKDRLVQGENIGQTFQFVFSTNAELGFVALSQVLDGKINGAGSRWDVPEGLHDPLRQQAVLLLNGQGNDAARAFLSYVKGPKALNVIQRFGYGVE